LDDGVLLWARAVRDVRLRDVRKAALDRRELLLDGGHARVDRRDLVPEASRLLLLGRGVLAGLLPLADEGGDGVPLGLFRIGLRDEAPALLVERAPALQRPGVVGAGPQEVREIREALPEEVSGQHRRRILGRRAGAIKRRNRPRLRIM